MNTITRAVRAAAAALVCLAGMAGAAAAQEPQIITGWDELALRGVLAEYQAQNVELLAEEGSEPVLLSRVGPLNLLISGAGCDENYQDCRAIRLIAINAYPEGLATTEAKVNFLFNLNIANDALKVVPNTEQAWVMSYFHLLEGGVTRDNLSAAVGGFAQSAVSLISEVAAQMQQQAPAEGAGQ